MSIWLTLQLLNSIDKRVSEDRMSNKLEIYWNDNKSLTLMEEILETLESLTPTSKIHYCKSRDFNILKTNTEETGKSVIFKKSYFRTELQKEKQMNFEFFLIPLILSHSFHFSSPVFQKKSACCVYKFALSLAQSHS